MKDPIDPTSVRQGRLGRQVLVILVASLGLAFMSGWVLWGAVANETDPFKAFTEMHKTASDSGSAETPGAERGADAASPSRDGSASLHAGN
ncbi:hypothetical protein [Hoeflea olei]|uniref:Uncharacterized protein n=1 Tax=Hoeflea olei TaxID=1480615 RepID=A0A1C1YTZ0_9HYPH|nr:hypothetical protein [Hoeflea olei]OCW56935.1 hypothetical protein AWJ14_07190 [Hoeflea olei]